MTNRIATLLGVGCSILTGLLFIHCTSEEEVDRGSVALSADQCSYFSDDSTLTVCHQTSSIVNPYVVISADVNSCAGHAGHEGDYIAVDDSSCNGEGCFPEGAPFDGSVACCEGLAPMDGVCAVDVCADYPCGDFGTCVLWSVTCDGDVTCDSLPPECPENTVPGRANSCWTGYCIPQVHCDALPERDPTAQCVCDTGHQGNHCQVYPKSVFVTSASYTGNLGGLDGADEACQGLADDAGLSGVYRAWLADSTGSPATRFTQWGGDYQRLDGAVVANGWNDLTDGDLDAAISIDENGAATTGRAWTNTSPHTGAILTSYHCLDWTDETGQIAPWDGIWGIITATDAQWSFYSILESCSVPKHLYCFEQ